MPNLAPCAHQDVDDSCANVGHACAQAARQPRQRSVCCGSCAGVDQLTHCLGLCHKDTALGRS
jgi:hypothetical protein